MPIFSKPKPLIKLFMNFCDHALFKIKHASKNNEITKFEEKAFTSFCLAAMLAAKTYLTTDTLPYKKIERPESDDIVLDAYFFLCAIELHTFLARLKNKKEIKKALDVPQGKLVKDFAQVFGGEEIENHLKGLLNSFDNIVQEMGDSRDLWYNQALLFGNKLSEGKVSFGDLTENDIATKLSISFVSSTLQIESAKLFDDIVLGKKD